MHLLLLHWMMLDTTSPMPAAIIGVVVGAAAALGAAYVVRQSDRDIAAEQNRLTAERFEKQRHDDWDRFEGEYARRAAHDAADRIQLLYVRLVQAAMRLHAIAAIRGKSGGNVWADALRECADVTAALGLEVEVSRTALDATEKIVGLVCKYTAGANLTGEVPAALQIEWETIDEALADLKTRTAEHLADLRNRAIGLSAR